MERTTAVSWAPLDQHAPGTIEVVIPARNAGWFLRETLRSVAAQTHPPDVVTVVDDASEDDTVAVAEACRTEFGDRTTFRVLPNAGPRGPSAARNTAIRQSRCEWIALLDADDLLAPSHHATLIAAVGAAPGIVLGFGDSTVFEGTRTLTARYLSTSGAAALPASEAAPGVRKLDEGIFYALLRHGIFATSACLFRRETALQVGLFDESMMRCEDTDFFLRLCLAGRFVMAGGVIAHKRVHEANLSHLRHRLAFARGTAVSLAKVGKVPELSAAQARALRQALRRAINGYLYGTSRLGLAAYRDAIGVARMAGHPSMAAHPRHLARLALGPLLRRFAPLASERA